MTDKDEFINGACNDLQGLLMALSGSHDISEQELWAIEPDDEQAVRKVIREHVRPNFMESKARSEKGQDIYNSYERCKEGLRFLISLNDEEAFDWIGNVGQFCMYPLEPKDYQQFYIWIWEELCGDEDRHIPDMEAYLQHTDPYQNLELDEYGQWMPKPAE